MNIANNEDDNFITAIINGVSERINGYCNQNIETADKTLYFYGNGSNHYLLPTFPVNTITSLKNRENPGVTFTTLVLNTDYYTTVKGQLTELYYPFGFIPTVEFELKYNTGYSTVPADVVMVALQMIKVTYDESVKGNNRLSINTINESKGGTTISTQFIDLTPKWKSELNKYRVPVYA